MATKQIRKCYDLKRSDLIFLALNWEEKVQDLENVKLSEINQSEKDKYHMISLICGI